MFRGNYHANAANTASSFFVRGGNNIDHTGQPKMLQGNLGVLTEDAKL